MFCIFRIVYVFIPCYWFSSDKNVTYHISNPCVKLCSCNIYTVLVYTGMSAVWMVSCWSSCRYCKIPSSVLVSIVSCTELYPPSTVVSLIQFDPFEGLVHSRPGIDSCAAVQGSSVIHCTPAKSYRIYIYIYTECHRRNGRNFGRVFLMLNYTGITRNTYVPSWTVIEIMANKIVDFLRVHER